VPMAWLVRDGQVIASLEVAHTRAARRRGLLGRESIEGGMLFRPARWVHTVGMRIPIDVAFFDAEGTVVAICTMKRNRLGKPRVTARCVIEARAGAFAKWGVTAGDELTITDAKP
jgi:uncharacterized membrane protein (UPF0127 family)